MSKNYKISEEEIATLIEIPGDLGDDTETESSDDECYFVTEKDFLNNISDYDMTQPQHNIEQPSIHININGNYIFICIITNK